MRLKCLKLTDSLSIENIGEGHKLLCTIYDTFLCQKDKRYLFAVLFKRTMFYKLEVLYIRNGFRWMERLAVNRAFVSPVVKIVFPGNPRHFFGSCVVESYSITTSNSA